jgi:hypothetical protein
MSKILAKNLARLKTPPKITISPDLDVLDRSESESEVKISQNFLVQALGILWALVVRDCTALRSQ